LFGHIKPYSLKNKVILFLLDYNTPLIISRTKWCSKINVSRPSLLAALHHMLPKPLRHFCVWHASCLISNPGNDDSPLQLPSVYYNPSRDGCAHDTAERKDNAKRGFGQQNLAEERQDVI